MNTPSVEILFNSLIKEKDTIQKAKIISELHNDKEISLKEIASRLKKHPSYVSHYIRILSLPSIVLDGYYAKQISAAHLFILSRLKDQDNILQAYEKILAKSLNTADTEELIRELKFHVNTCTTMLSKEEIEEISTEMKKEFPQAKIKITQTRIKGKVTIEFKGDTEVTSEIIKKIGEKCTEKNYTDSYEDELQVLE